MLGRSCLSRSRHRVDALLGGKERQRDNGGPALLQHDLAQPAVTVTVPTYCLEEGPATLQHGVAQPAVTAPMHCLEESSDKGVALLMHAVNGGDAET